MKVFKNIFIEKKETLDKGLKNQNNFLSKLKLLQESLKLTMLFW
jgi:hypothetical protein